MYLILRETFGRGLMPFKCAQLELYTKDELADLVISAYREGQELGYDLPPSEYIIILQLSAVDPSTVISKAFVQDTITRYLNEVEQKEFAEYQRLKAKFDPA